MLSGYSTTPLVKKLGIKEGFKVIIINSPESYTGLVQEIPEKVVFLDEESLEKADLIHIFVKFLKEYEDLLLKYKSSIVTNGSIWISWPKKASGISTDLDDNKIRDFALDQGLVDVKVCAVNEIWSGLKLVYRVKNRDSVE